MVVSGSADTRVRLWDLRNKNCVQQYRRHTDQITSLRFSPDAYSIFTASKDSTLKVWDTRKARDVSHTSREGMGGAELLILTTLCPLACPPPNRRSTASRLRRRASRRCPHILAL